MSSNVAGKAYALTLVCPIKSGTDTNNVAFADAIRDQLEGWNAMAMSPMAYTPNTYLCRFYILDDVCTQSLPGAGIWDTISDILPAMPATWRLAALPYEDHLKSRYLVFTSDFHGDLEPYLQGLWRSAETDVRSIWRHCYGFDGVSDAASFVDYARRCQLDTSLFFVGSNDDSLAAQLKALYVKQEFSHFAQQTQDMPAAQLRQAYLQFMQRVKPRDDAGPSWTAGQRA